MYIHFIMYSLLNCICKTYCLLWANLPLSLLFLLTVFTVWMVKWWCPAHLQRIKVHPSENTPKPVYSKSRAATVKTRPTAHVEWHPIQRHWFLHKTCHLPLWYKNALYWPNIVILQPALRQDLSICKLKDCQEKVLFWLNKVDCDVMDWSYPYISNLLHMSVDFDLILNLKEHD